MFCFIILDENSLQTFVITLAIGKIDKNKIKLPYAILSTELFASPDIFEITPVKERIIKIKKT